ncbi:hypothetical protein, partial [Proteus mirabilis]
NNKGTNFIKPINLYSSNELQPNISFEEIYNSDPDDLYKYIFYIYNDKLGNLKKIDDNIIIFSNNGNETHMINNIQFRKKIKAKPAIDFLNLK